MKIDIELLFGKINGTLTDDEANRVNAWLEGSPNRRRYFEQLKQYNISGPERPSENRFASNRVIFYDNMLQSDFSSMRRRKLNPLWGGVAAAAIIVFIFGTMLFNRNLPPRITGYEFSYEHLANKSSNGDVVLLTPLGEKIDLSNLEDAARHESFLISEEILEMTTPSSQVSEQSGIYKVIVKKGAEQLVKLSDGTKIWLNSHSELHYPTVFDVDSRKVFVRGEAYFEVAKESDRPFIVSTGISDIRVHGTEFNVNTRKENIVATTLVKGSVSVIMSGINRETRLSPGEMAEVDHTTGRITISRVDVDLYTGWKNGIYLFRDTRIDDVLNEIALWYDLEVNIENRVLRDEKFSGSIRRDTPLKNILDMLERTGHVSLHIDGNRLKVTKPR